MNDRHLRAKELFLEAIERPAEQRATFVAQACNGDAELEREVRELLGHHQDDPRIDTPLGDYALLETLPEPFPPPPPGLRIVQLLGRGGMGSVWLAERASDGALVAVKLLTAGTHSREMLARFKREAEILRKLSHPGIARLLDAGVYHAPHGDQPYLLLEYVEGMNFSAYAAAQSLDMAQRLALLQQLAEAVSHAHANGVVHRDLKPENILVDAHGRVRVLDFGVARFVDAEGGSLATRTGIMLGTPQYMSPEQVQADPAGVGPACDVYALGVLGFELLGGKLPYDVRAFSLHRAVVTVLTVEPPRLGTLGALLRGDLENVIAKALEKDPADRYADAGALAEDLRRYLEGRPVSVRAPSPMKRVWRGIRQRRLLVPGLLIAMLVAAGFLVPRVQEARGDAQWQGFFARMVNADDLVHDEKHRSLELIEEARQQLLECRRELPALPDRSYRRMAQSFIAARLGETHWILGDLRSDPSEFEAALPECLHARSSYQAPGSYTGMERFPTARERFEALVASDLNGLVGMGYRELARYRRPAENYLLACHLCADGGRDLLARFGLKPPVHGHENPRSYFGWPDTMLTVSEYVFYSNDCSAAHLGYARAAQDTGFARVALAMAREARRFVSSVAGADPATGSVFFTLGDAFLVHARVTGQAAELDSAQTAYETCLAFRGPDRPHQYCETKRSMAEVQFARADMSADAATHARAAERAMAHVEDARSSLAPSRQAQSSEYAWLDLVRARALLLKAEATGDANALQDALAPLDEAAAVFPSQVYPVQASWNALLRARHARVLWQRTHAPAAVAEAGVQLATAHTLAASQDRELEREIERERALLRAK